MQCIASTSVYTIFLESKTALHSLYLRPSLASKWRGFWEVVVLGGGEAASGCATKREATVDTARSSCGGAAKTSPSPATRFR